MLLVDVALGIGYVCDHLEYHIIEGLSVLGGMCSFSKGPDKSLFFALAVGSLCSVTEI